jgi:hypothetical protein
LEQSLGVFEQKEMRGVACHKHEEIGKTVGQERVAKEKQLQQRVRKIEEALTKSKKRP